MGVWRDDETGSRDLLRKRMRGNLSRTPTNSNMVRLVTFIGDPLAFNRSSTQTLNMRGGENVYITGSSDEEDRLMRPYDECSSDTAAPYSINTPVVLKKWAAAAR
ncbi:otoferlin [Trichonephila inaurata madagascariensis]|uniref:Otoferlin n=1 Tax=Trichonephila inaurata madagascariensis TaxID=2747483 RepID=A0A8X6WWJ9_9ARAC|nr:otoferlin [Trichonephila inaurata madagascariensis]